MSSQKPKPGSKASLQYWLLHEHEVLGCICEKWMNFKICEITFSLSVHDPDDVLTRWVHVYVLILHLLLGFATTVILYAMFSTTCDVVAFCAHACAAITGSSCLTVLVGSNSTTASSIAVNASTTIAPTTTVVVADSSNAVSYVLTSTNGDPPQVRSSLFRLPFSNDPRYQYCKLQGMQNDLACVEECATADSIVNLNAELKSRVPLLRPPALVKSIEWRPASLCTGVAGNSSGGVQQRDKALYCTRERSAGVDCGKYLTEPGYWTTKVLITVFTILLFSFMKPFLRLAHRVDRCAVWRACGYVMCALLLVPILAALIAAAYVAAVFIGSDGTIWAEIWVTVGITYGLVHLFLISPLKITLAWFIAKKCCPQKEEDFIEMFE
jgi:hypothetical protein